ncbi:hypothetical protein [Pleionea sp. CnH1-48]|uniref:hypothetical protein n=1 Tax=Pleionea sp. CnH1-48 TaxID=2954494 RepID=UPI002096CD07|nr:hypothetical protein [Pleionea sp. CnH1-48]MCO7224668.1 hypothetical protein [Pleionea sp. CnH1-48]
MKKLFALSAIALLSTGAALAEQPSYDFVEFGYAELDEADGFVLRGNAEINDHFYFNGGYQILSQDSNDLDEVKIGIGFKMPVTSNTSFFAHVDYLDWEFDNNAGSASGDGFEIGAGVRSNVRAGTELFAELSRKDGDIESVDLEETYLTLGLRQSFNKNFGGFAEYFVGEGDDNDGFRLGIQYSF